MSAAGFEPATLALKGCAALNSAVGTSEQVVAFSPMFMRSASANRVLIAYSCSPLHNRALIPNNQQVRGEVCGERTQRKLSTVTEPPDFLSGEAREIWLRSATTLAARGILKPLYVHWFAAFCTTYAKVKQLRKAAATAPTAAERADYLEQLEMEWQPLLNDFLSDMDFDSEGEFEKFVEGGIQ